jgi:hypothetical protein
MKRQLGVEGFIISVIISVSLISVDFLLLDQQQQAKAQNQSIYNKILTGLGIIHQARNQTNAFHTYANPTYGMTMNYPANWTYNEGNPIMKAVRQNLSSAQNVSAQNLSSALRTIHFLAYFYPTNVGSNGSVAPPVLVLAVKDNESSMTKYVSEILGQQNKNPHFHLDDRKLAMLGGHKAEQLVYNSIDNEGRPTKTMDIVAVKGNQIYLFLFSSPPQTYANYLRAVANMRDSLLIK